ncbi:hypothetical protein FFZ77_19220 [Streptomyces katsurahamanus]|uniref:TetR family transcriptional regulator n=1 Tax=Streptomyces katsurahamanus TaxID=2577098 RepID=A0ABW9NWI0_9ACTN|nr:hypothetical protein [Streptomyces katsurahamanus]
MSAPCPVSSKRQRSRSTPASTASRTAAIRQHVLEMTAPVVAEALSYHRVTTAKLASEAGGTWNRHAS